MAMSVAPVIGRASIDLRVSPGLQSRLSALAAGRPLVIDYFTSCLRGVVVGDLIVRLGEPRSEPCYIELEPIGEVSILAQRHLVDLLDGATLREAGPPWASPPGDLASRPEAWIDFLDRHPSRRR